MNIQDLLLESYKAAKFEKLLLESYQRLILEEAGDDDVPGDKSKPQNLTNPREPWNDLRPNSKVGRTEDGEYYIDKIKTTREAYDTAVKARNDKKESLPTGDEWIAYVAAHDGITKEKILEPLELKVEQTKQAWLNAVKAARNDDAKKEFDSRRSAYLAAKAAGETPKVEEITQDELDKLKGKNDKTTDKTTGKIVTKPVKLDDDFINKTPAHLKAEEDLKTINVEVDKLAEQIQIGKKEDGTDLSEDEKTELRKSLAKKLERKTELNGEIQAFNFELTAKKNREREKTQIENNYFNRLPGYAQEMRVEQIRNLNQTRKDLKEEGKLTDAEIEAKIEEIDTENKRAITQEIAKKSVNPKAVEEIDEKAQKQAEEIKNVTKEIKAFMSNPDFKKLSDDEKNEVQNTLAEIKSVVYDENGKFPDEETRKAEADRLYQELLISKIPAIRAEKEEINRRAQEAIDKLKAGKEVPVKDLQQIRDDEQKKAKEDAINAEKLRLKNAYLDKVDASLKPLRLQQYNELEDLYSNPAFLAKTEEEQKEEKNQIIARHNEVLNQEKERLQTEQDIEIAIRNANAVAQNPNASEADKIAARKKVTDAENKKNQIAKVTDSENAIKKKTSDIYKELDPSLKSPYYYDMLDKINAKRDELQGKIDRGEKNEDGTDIDYYKELNAVIDSETDYLKSKNEELKITDKRTPEEKERDEKIALLTPAAKKLETEYLAAYKQDTDPELYALKKNQADELKEIMLDPSYSKEDRDRLITSKMEEHARAEVIEKKRIQERNDLIAEIKKPDPNATTQKAKEDAIENQRTLRMIQDIEDDKLFDNAISNERKLMSKNLKNSPEKALKFADNNKKLDSKIDELREKVKNEEMTRDEMMNQLQSYKKELDDELEKVGAKDEFEEVEQAIVNKKQTEYLDKYDSIKEPELKALKIKQFQEIKDVYLNKELSAKEKEDKIKELEKAHVEEEDYKQSEMIKHKKELLDSRKDLSIDLKELSDAELREYTKNQSIEFDKVQKMDDFKRKNEAEKKLRDEYIKSLSPDLQVKFFKDNKAIEDKKIELQKKVASGDITQEEMDSEISDAEDKRDQELKEAGEKAQQEKTESQKIKDRAAEIKKLADSDKAFQANLSPAQKIVREKQLEAIADINADLSISPEEKQQKLDELEKIQRRALEDIKFEEEKKVTRQKEFNKKFKNGDLTSAQIERMQEQNNELNDALDKIDNDPNISPEEKLKLKNKKREELEEQHLKELEAMDPSKKAQSDSVEATKKLNDINNQISELEKKTDLSTEEQDELEKLKNDKEAAEKEAEDAKNKLKEIEALKTQIDALEKKYESKKASLSAQIKNQKEQTDLISNTNFASDKPENPYLSKFISKLRIQSKLAYLKKLNAIGLNSDLISTKISDTSNQLKKAETEFKKLEQGGKNSTTETDQEKVKIEASKQEEQQRKLIDQQVEQKAKAELEAGGLNPEEADKKIDDAKLEKEKRILDFKIENAEKKLKGAQTAFDKLYAENSGNPATDAIAINIEKIEKSLKELKEKRQELGESFTSIEYQLYAIEYLIDNVMEHINLYLQK